MLWVFILNCYYGVMTNHTNPYEISLRWTSSVETESILLKVNLRNDNGYVLLTVRGLCNLYKACHTIPDGNLICIFSSLFLLTQSISHKSEHWKLFWEFCTLSFQKMKNNNLFTSLLWRSILFPRGCVVCVDIN